MPAFFRHPREMFKASFRSLSSTQTLTTVGILMAIQIVLSSLGAIQLGDSLRVSLSHLALAPTAMLFGPIPAAIQGALSDFLAFIIKPTGPYFPGFTLSKALSGIFYGCIFYQAEVSVKRIVSARLLVMVLINILMNTLWLMILRGPSQIAMLPVRMVKNLVQLPIDCLLLYVVCRTVARMPASHPTR